MSTENEPQAEIINNENVDSSQNTPQDQNTENPAEINESPISNEKSEVQNSIQLTIEKPTTIIENEEVNNAEQNEQSNQQNENEEFAQTNETTPNPDETDNTNETTDNNPLNAVNNEAIDNANPEDEENPVNSEEISNNNQENETIDNENPEIENQNAINDEEIVNNNEIVEKSPEENLQDVNPLPVENENDQETQNFLQNENAGTSYQENNQNDEIDIPIQYQGQNYSPNLANSQSVAVESRKDDPENPDFCDTDSSSRRNAQSQRIATPTEPIGQRNGSAPRPRSQRNKNAQQQSQNVRIENIDDEERPSSACSSYSYTYSYSETEEEITRPVKHRKKQLEDYIPNYLKEQLQSISALQTQRTAMVSDEDLENLKKKAKNFQNLENYPNEAYEVLLNSLMDERTEMAVRENFKECEKLNRVIEHVSHCYLEQRKYDLQTESYNQMMDQLDEVNAKLEQFDQESKEKEQKLEKATEQLLQQIQDDNDKKLNDIQDQWNQEGKMRQYNRASPRLVYLRKQFKGLMRQCKFQEAEDVKKMILALEKEEQEKAAASIQTRFQDAVQKAEIKQNEKLRLYQTRQETKLKQIRMERKRLREALENQLKKVEDQRAVINDPDKLWNYNKSQKKKDTARSVRAIQPDMNLSRLTSNAFTEREDTTLHLPKLTLKRNTRMTAASSRK